METLRIGSLCYFDSFSGLIPGKVVAIVGPSGWASTAQSVGVAITARDARGGYRVGEVISCSGLRAVPRGAVKFRKYGARIVAYMVQA
jgi:hypothetical protein